MYRSLRPSTVFARFAFLVLFSTVFTCCILSVISHFDVRCDDATSAQQEGRTALANHLSAPRHHLLHHHAALSRGKGWAAFTFANAQSGELIDITIGYLRMSGIDMDAGLAGFAATIHQANMRNTSEFIMYHLDVTTIPCANTAECLGLSPEDDAFYIQSFLDRMVNFTAVIKPNHLLAPRIIDHATAIGGVPVLDPLTVRLKDFNATSTPHVINFEQDVESELAHIFRFMQQASGCSYSAILYEDFSDMVQHIPTIQKMFTDAGMPAPPPISYAAATNDELFAFMAEDSRRVCYINMMTYEVAVATTQRLDEVTTFLPGAASFFGMSMTQGPQYLVSGKPDAFANTYFVRWSPEYKNSRYTRAAGNIKRYFDNWIGTSAADAFTGVHWSAKPTSPNDAAFAAYLVVQYLIDNVRETIFENRAKLELTKANPVPWTLLINNMYGTMRSVGDFPFHGRMTRTCPPSPLPEVCSCSIPTVTSFMMRCDPKTSVPFTVYDNETLGQRNIATIEFKDCANRATSRSYPITSLLIRLDAAALASKPMLLEAQNVIDSRFLAYVHEENYAPVEPVRPVRYASLTLTDGLSTVDAIKQLSGRYNPFVILGSLGDVITESEVLTLMPALGKVLVEDNPLVSHGQWQSNIINILPVLADYIHAMASYYHQNVHHFSAFYAIASTLREAELISLSMATFGYDVPVSSITISAQSLLWSVKLAAWMLPDGTAKNPFVLAVTAANPDNVISAAFTIASSESLGQLALAASIIQIHNARQQFTMSGSRDVIFGSMIQDWWLPSKLVGLSADQARLADNPVYWFARTANDMTAQLSQRALYDYSAKAAEVLYEMGTFTSQGVAYGPFSNTTCTDEQIEKNVRRRECQCTKAARTIFVVSVNNWQHQQPSTRTGGFYYRMTTCGVEYKPYVAPPVDNSLSKGSIAGIAVGASFGGILLIVGSILYYCFFVARNNRAAPKDPSSPFTIVFTDIQSSTALWARAPSAMSEAVDQHHEIIRDVIANHNGYEVKTIGDSFMIAFKDPRNAVAFAIDVQEALFAAEWNSEINACYVEILSEMAAAQAQAEIDADTSAGSTEIKEGSGFAHIKAGDSVSWVSASQQAPQCSGAVISGSNVPPIAVEKSSPKHTHHGDKKVPIVSPTKKGAAHGLSADSPFVEGRSSDLTIWNGLRVRIGVSHGYGDIRKDPITHGYDYYGTVVNAAARVEGVGHGGQILITDETNNSLPRDFILSKGGVPLHLGAQPLRGLDMPVRLIQILPASLQRRTFPPLRLHIEIEVTDDTTNQDTATSSTATLTNFQLAEQLCATRQFHGLVSVDELLSNVNVFQTIFSPTKTAFRNQTIASLGQAWGFGQTAKAVKHENSRMRLIVNLMGRVSRTININANKTEGGVNTNKASTADYESSRIPLSVAPPNQLAPASYGAAGNRKRSQNNSAAVFHPTSDMSATNSAGLFASPEINPNQVASFSQKSDTGSLI